MPYSANATGPELFEEFDAVMEENDALGEWEDNDSTPGPERWLFPRNPGVTDPASMYLSRAGIDGHDTDVETIVSWLEAPRSIVGAILLLGEPGTGKTALVEAAVTHSMPEVKPKRGAKKPPPQESPLLTVLCTPDHTKDSLFLRFVGEGKGDPLPSGERSPYTLGPVPYAAKHGRVLYLDEAYMLIDGVKPLIYSLADGRDFLPEGNVDGSPLEIHPDFRLILSANPVVRGASLPEPLASRAAGTTLTVETDAALLHDLSIDEGIVGAWEALGTAGLWRPQIRELRVADYWLSKGNQTQAVSAFIPEHCPESSRTVVRDIVVSFLGSGIRPDGRLAVS